MLNQVARSMNMTMEELVLPAQEYNGCLTGEVLLNVLTADLSGLLQYGGCHSEISWGLGWLEGTRKWENSSSLLELLSLFPLAWWLTCLVNHFVSIWLTTYGLKTLQKWGIF